MLNKYAAERGIPRIPACSRSRASLQFNGSFLIMTTGVQTQIYPAVSGQPNEKGLFDYSLKRQYESRKGPIPRGKYWIQPSQMWTNHWYNISPRSAWGNHRITIHIFSETKTYDRGGFFIHGGNHLGSAGCINLHSQMEKFVMNLQKAIQDIPDCYIPLIVSY